jgi:DNA repair exonuclease SbcCD nuclease subunit
MKDPIPYWIFTADVHAGDIPQGSLQREEDIYQSWQRLCHIAAADPLCSGVFGDGDMRDKPTIQSRNLDGFNKGIHILHEAGKSLLAIMGNHDFTTPNWITGMHHPSFQDAADPNVLRSHGINPETTVATHYLKRPELLAWLESLGAERREKIRTLILHLSLQDLANANQKAEISLQELSDLGFGKSGPTLVLLGDLHNYGDAQIGNLQAVYPGSLEMTDRNEGVNGFQSTEHPLEKPDFRKFALKWWPNGKDGNSAPAWERFEVSPRPWYYVRVAKTKEKTTKAKLEAARKAIASWSPERPGIVTLILPEKEIETTRPLFQDLISQGRILQLDIEPYVAEINGEEEPLPEGSLLASNWQETTRLLPEMAREDQLPAASQELLDSLISNDGSTHSIKTDVTSAWESWKKPKEETSPTTQEPQPSNP